MDREGRSLVEDDDGKQEGELDEGLVGGEGASTEVDGTGEVE